MERLFITGISTDVGKTVVSAILCEKFGYDYWKPVQCGLDGGGDKAVIKNLVSNPKCKIHEPAFELKAPMSPHAAATLEGAELTVAKIINRIPETENTLLIEGAGGILVPINDSECIIDIAKSAGCKVILVSMHYLGSINHTLMSLEILKGMNIEVEAVVFVGEENVQTESAIKKRFDGINYKRIHLLNEVNQRSIKESAELY